MESYIENLNIDNHPFVQKLERASMSSFVNSQISMLGFHDNWMRMVSGFLVKVPEAERFKIIDHLWRFNGSGRQESSKMSSFKRMMYDLGFIDDLVPYQKCDSHKSLTTYVYQVKDQIPKNTWLFCISMLSAILYTKSLIDRKIMKFLVHRTDVSVSFLDTVDDAFDLMQLCKPYFETNTDEVTAGFNFGCKSMIDFYNGLAELLEDGEPSGLSTSGTRNKDDLYYDISSSEEVNQEIDKPEVISEKDQTETAATDQPSEKPFDLFDGIKLEGVDINDPDIQEALRILSEAPNEYNVEQSKDDKANDADDEDELYS